MYNAEEEAEKRRAEKAAEEGSYYKGPNHKFNCIYETRKRNKFIFPNNDKQAASTFETFITNTIEDDEYRERYSHIPWYRKITFTLAIFLSGMCPIILVLYQEYTKSNVMTVIYFILMATFAIFLFRFSKINEAKP